MTSSYGVTNHPSRTTDQESSVSSTPQVTDEHKEFKDISFDADDYEDTRCPTDVSPVEARSVVQADLKRARGVRDRITSAR
jgi:hypothetical protein